MKFISTCTSTKMKRFVQFHTLENLPPDLEMSGISRDSYDIARQPPPVTLSL